MVTMSYLKRSEVAKILQVNPLTVFRWVKEKRLTAVKNGRLLRFREEDVLSFLKPTNEKPL